MSWQNIVGTYLLATDDEEYKGSKWYDEARLECDRIAESLVINKTLAYGVCSALSPNNKWERNLTDTYNLIKWTLEHTNSLSTSLSECLASSGDIKVATYNSNKEKAIKILYSYANVDTIRQILSGPKVTEFFNCISATDPDDICIDGHAYSIWLGDYVPTSKTPSIGIKLRQAIKDDYRRATNVLNHKLNLTLSNHMVQATTWVTHKRLVGEGAYN